MLRALSSIVLLSFILVSVFAQTFTVPDPDGSTNSVVEVVSIDPDTNEPTTTIISTISPAAATTAPADAPGQDQGPVGAPPDTATLTGPPPIMYTFTTTDVNGDREVITTIFTPTYQQPNPTTPLSSGTIWNLNDYTQQFGGAAAATHGSASSLIASRPHSWGWTIGCGVMAIGAGGFLLI